MNKKTKKRKAAAPHRYFVTDYAGEVKIVVFKNGKDGIGRSYYIDGAAQNCWWSFGEMKQAIEIPAKLLKRVARL